MKRIRERLFYTYLYFDVRPGKESEVIYVGKGTCQNSAKRLKRMYQHWLCRQNHPNVLFGRILRRIESAGLTPRIVLDQWHATEILAFEREMELISVHGTRAKRTGTLCNLTLGGEGACGREVTAATKETLRQKGISQWTEFACREQSERLREYSKNPEVKMRLSAQLSQAHSVLKANPEIIASRAITLRETCKDPDLRKRYSENRKAVLARPGFLEKLSANVKKVWEDPELRHTQRMRSMAVWGSEELREKQSSTMKKKWEEKKVEGMSVEEKVRRSDAAKRRWAEKRDKIVGGIRKAMTSEETSAKLKQAWALRKTKNRPKRLRRNMLRILVRDGLARNQSS